MNDRLVLLVIGRINHKFPFYFLIYSTMNIVVVVVNQTTTTRETDAEKTAKPPSDKLVRKEPQKCLSLPLPKRCCRRPKVNNNHEQRRDVIQTEMTRFDTIEIEKFIRSSMQILMSTSKDQRISEGYTMVKEKVNAMIIDREKYIASHGLKKPLPRVGVITKKRI
jgi:hypothetical protein